MDVRHKIITPHIKGCNAVKETKKGNWEHPWCDWVDRQYFASKDGYEKKGSSTIIHEYRCNSTRCNARIKVWVNDVLKLFKS